MFEFGIPMLTLLAGLVAGALLTRVMPGQAAPPADDRVALLQATVSRLTHDVRGAISPALLMAERLERHEDAAVRRDAEVIARALDRTASLCREISAAMKRLAEEA